MNEVERKSLAHELARKIADFKGDVAERYYHARELIEAALEKASIVEK